MRRRHLFEFEDLAWFPKTLRNGTTDFLRFVSMRFDLFKPVTGLLEKALERSGQQTIVDLASGGGGAWGKLAPRLVQRFPRLKVHLTDWYPNPEGLSMVATRFPDIFVVEEEPVDARAVPRALPGLRTQFLSLHHFRTEDVRAILQNAVDGRQPIAIFEAQKRDWGHLLKFALAPVLFLLVTPWIRPFRWSRLLFTYLIPLIPLATLWDGCVSVLRTYDAEELRRIIQSLKRTESFEWEIGETASRFATIPYLLGCPRDGRASDTTRQ